MFRSYKFRLMPTKAQAASFDATISTCRFVYNLALETKITAYKSAGVSLSAFDLQKQLTQLKKDYEWIQNAPAECLNQSIINMENAFKGFYRGKGFPRFKKKGGTSKMSVRQYVKIKDNKVYFTGMRDGVKVILHRDLKYKIRVATIIKNGDGKYFISCLVNTGDDIPLKQPILNDSTIGIDVGIKNFATCSDGKIIDNPKFYKKSISKLKYLSSQFSKNKNKSAKTKLAAMHSKITNQRSNFLHQTSAYLINNHDTICIEKLNVAGMRKNRKLSQAISDASWAEFVNQLKYKAEWYGKNILTIDRFAPSSKTCSECGSINHLLKLSDREWVCSGCAAVLDRDLNAAINIKNFALKSLCVERIQKNQEELPALMGSQDA